MGKCLAGNVLRLTRPGGDVKQTDRGQEESLDAPCLAVFGIPEPAGYSLPDRNRLKPYLVLAESGRRATAEPLWPTRSSCSFFRK